MTFIWIIITIALAAVWAITIFDIVRSRLGGKRTVAWLLLVLLLPFGGAVVYWVTRKPEAGEAEYVAALERQARHDAQHRP